jgi:virginiamycin B lyase
MENGLPKKGLPKKELPGLQARSLRVQLSAGPFRRKEFQMLPAVGLATALVAVLLLPAAAGAIDEFPVPGGGDPGGITAGPDGALWFVEEGSSEIGRITPTGVVTNEYPVSTTSGADPNRLDQITVGPDGALWFTEPRDNSIGRITTAGAITEFPLPVPGGQPEGISAGPDSNLWFTAAGLNQIGRISTAGTIDLFAGASPGASDITAGPDGALWFTESGTNTIGRITTAGTVTNHYPVPTPASEPSGITTGPGGLWFTESAANQIGFITTGGAVTEFPGTAAGPSAIATGADGALWFTESEGSTIGRITTGGLITNHFPTPTPASQPSDMTPGPDGALWFTEFTGQRIGRIVTAPAVAPVPPPQVPIVSRKAKPKRCKVPKLRGLTVKQAKRKLKRAGCRHRVIGKGRVVSSSPKAGKRTRGTVKVTAKPPRKRSSK